MSEEFRMKIPARISMLTKLTRRIETFGHAHGIPDPKIFLINLALDELITNTVRHGLQDVRNAEIEIRLRREDDRMVLTVEDNGDRFDPTSDEIPVDTTSALHDRGIGGLGLHLVRSFADKISYRFTDQRNQLTITHNLDPAEA